MNYQLEVREKDGRYRAYIIFETGKEHNGPSRINMETAKRDLYKLERLHANVEFDPRKIKDGGGGVSATRERAYVKTNRGGRSEGE